MTPIRWQLIQQLFEAAEKLPAGERPGYLRLHCGADESLYRQVDSLLEASSPDRPKIETTYIASEHAAFPRIRNYKLTRVIGSGGMGVVYEAEQRSPQRRVALKVIRRELRGEGQLERRFQREAEALALLRHPGIATIYEAGTTDDGHPFLAMELVRGVELGDWMWQQPQAETWTRKELARRLRLFQGVAAAVAYAHQNGVIHRDLKPSNIIVMPAEEEAVPQTKILDFGLARIMRIDSRERTDLTTAGDVQGTVPYMSPEQASGDIDRVDTRSDLYALGVILYKMITGRHPYLQGDPAVAEALGKILHTPPTPLSAYGVRFDEDLETMLQKALQKEPDQRYQSVSTLIGDVERYLSDLPLVARPPSALYQIRKLVRRHRVAFGAAAALFVLTVAFAITAGVQAAIIRAERNRANAEAAAARQTANFLVDLLRKAKPNGSEDMTVRDLLRQARQRLDGELREQPALRADLLDVLGQSFVGVGPFDEAVKALREAIAVREKLHGKNDPPLIKTWSQLSNAYYNNARYSESAEAAREAVRIAEASFGPNSPEVAGELSGLAHALGATGALAESEPLLRRAVAIDRSTPKVDPEDAADRLRTFGWLLQQLERYPEAIQSFEQSVQILESKAPDSLTLTRAYNDFGVTYNLAGYPEKGEPCLRKTLERVSKQLGAKHHNTALVAGNLVHSLNQQSKYGEAERLAREALAIFDARLGTNHPRRSDLLTPLGTALLGQRKFTEAGGMLEAAFALKGKSDGPVAAPDTAIELARSRIATGSPGHAIALMQALIQGLNEKERGKTRHWLRAHRVLGEAYAAQGNGNAARTALTVSMEGFRDRLGATHPETRQSQKALLGLAL